MKNNSPYFETASAYIRRHIAQYDTAGYALLTQRAVEQLTESFDITAAHASDIALRAMAETLHDGGIRFDLNQSDETCLFMVTRNGTTVAVNTRMMQVALSNTFPALKKLVS